MTQKTRTAMLNQGVIGANRVYSIIDDPKRRGVPVEEAKSTEQNFAKLMNIGRISAVAPQDDMADPYIAKYAFTDIEKLPIPIASKDYFLIFSCGYADKNGALIKKLWDLIGEIRDRKSREVMPNYSVP